MIYIYIINNEICVDCLIRYENLQEGLNIIFDKLDMKRETIPKINSNYRNRSISTKDFLTQEMIELINHKYSFEINTLKYQLSD